MSVRKRRIRDAFVFGALFIALLAFLPLILVAVAVDQSFFQRRLRQLASDFTCENCGAILGNEALQAADAEWQQAQRTRNLLGFRLRLTRELHAICIHCETRYRHDRGGRTFRPMAGGAAGPAAS